MSWLEKLTPSQVTLGGEKKKNVPEGLWTKCEGCNSVLYRAELTIAKFSGTALARKPNQEGVPVMQRK